VHTLFNIFTTAILCPFCNTLEKIANKVIRSNTEDVEGAFLDERLLNTPAMAVVEANAMTGKMATIAGEAIASAVTLLDSYTDKIADQVIKQEDELDKFEDKLGSFLAQLSSYSLSERDSRETSKLLHTIGDFERLGDHAAQVQKCAQEIYQKKITFSEKAVEEINTMTAAIREIVDLTTRAFVNHDLALAQRVEPLEQVVDVLAARSKKNHIDRVQNGKCTIQIGFVLSDLLANYRRISDHCSNIAVAVIESEKGDFDAHQYLNEVKESGSHNFAEYHKEYCKKYGV
jgi:phosphate:Na+ symporter